MLRKPGQNRAFSVAGIKNRRYPHRLRRPEAGNNGGINALHSSYVFFLQKLDAIFYQDLLCSFVVSNTENNRGKFL